MSQQSDTIRPSFDMLRQKQSNRLIVSQTLEAVSHEIRNPLMAVGGLARRLSRTVPPSSAGGECVQCILDEVSRLEQTMTEMAGANNSGFFLSSE
jgi:nitrogen-specific signal transduction histidine kinase